MHTIKYRMIEERLRPRRTKLQIPGWAGKPEPRADGSHEYAWHCVPFSEAAQYGVEVFYPYANELRVSTREGRLVFDGDFGPAPEDGRYWPPFRTFGEQFYTYQILLDLKVEAGFAIKIEPHPRFYTDPTDTVPIAVPALIRNWWPMMSFGLQVTGGRPHACLPTGRADGAVHAIPADCDFELVEMGEEEAAERELQSRRIHESRDNLGADSQWTSASNTVFDATYRRLHGAATKLPRARRRS